MLPIIKLAIILIIMLIIISRKINLSYALMAGILLTSIFFNHFIGIINDFHTTLTDFFVWELIVIFFFVFYLSNMMTESGLLEIMLSSLQRLVKDVRFVIISLPFVIGFVPAPSGAMLSAPFTEEVGNKIRLSPEKKLIINYWFRHVTEYTNPLMPGVILAVSLLGISFKEFFLVNLPIMLFAFLLGFYMFTIKLKNFDKNNSPRKGDVTNVFNGLWPLLVAILLPVVFQVRLLYSLIIAIILIIIANKIKFPKLIKSIKKSVKIDVFIMIFLIMLFKTVISESNALEQVTNSFIEIGFPPIVLIISIPLIMGLLTGITIGYVGLSFPLIMPFLKPLGTIDYGFAMLAFVSGFIGVLASPMHLCLSVTQKYFKASYNKFYRLLIPSLIIFLAFTVLLTLVGWPPFN